MIAINESVKVYLEEVGSEVWAVFVVYDDAQPLMIGQLRQDLVNETVSLINYHGFERPLYANVSKSAPPEWHVLEAACSAALAEFFKSLVALDFVTSGLDDGQDDGGPITAPEFFDPPLVGV